MIKSLLCKAIGHSVNRHRVWHDGLNFRTKCENCRAPMIRTRSGWRLFDTAVDSCEHREPHPNSDKAA